jgi:glutathione-specific gamma-glutamylcyclotransferase
VTLVEENEGMCYGAAYKITGSLALSYLEQRECTLGGYMTAYTKFYPRVATEFSGLSGEAFPVLLYIATPANDYWMGNDSLEKIAEQIATASGPVIFSLINVPDFFNDRFFLLFSFSLVTMSSIYCD